MDGTTIIQEGAEMKLKIKLKLDDKTISGRVLEQDEDLRGVGAYMTTLIENEDFKICTRNAPQLTDEILFVRGECTNEDDKLFDYTFNSTETAKDTYKDIVSLVNKLNGELGGVVDELGNALYIDENGDALAKVNGISKDQSAKADKGKLELSLVNPELVKAVAEVRMYGTEKYGDSENWRKVKPKRYVDALYRHLLAYIEGNEVDEESGLSHLAHMACNLSFLLDKEYLKEHESEV